MDTVAPPARFDPRGLVELDERVPGTAEIDGERAGFDARELTTRQINLELRRLIYELGRPRRDDLRTRARSTRSASGSSRAAGSPSRAASATSRAG